jgi:hypothetical protein
MISVSWDEPSARWLNELPKFGEKLLPHLLTAVDSTVQTMASRMFPDIPVFERAMQMDLQRTRATKCGVCEVEAFLYFSGATVNDASENWLGPKGNADAPFSIPAGKDEGIAEHKVYLYNKEGMSTEGRRKLIRYLKAQGGAYADVPEDADKSWWDHRKKDEKTAPPFVTVHPSTTPFWEKHIGANCDLVAQVLADNVYAAIGKVW